jgi:hypothetical protein
LVSRRARARRRVTWLGQQGHLTQDAFNWRDARPYIRAKPIRMHLTFTRDWLPHPFVRRGQTHHRRDGNRRVALPCVTLACLAAHPGDTGKMCLASLCNRSTTRAPTDRSIPERRTFVELTVHRTDTCSERPGGVLHPCGNRTPGRHKLDGKCPTSAKPTTPCPNGKDEHRTGRCHLAAAFSTACKIVRSGLWHSLSHFTGFGDRIWRSGKSPSVRTHVNKCDFPGTKCLPSTSAPEGARHRARGLAAGEPASSALSLRECLRTSKLDQSRIRRFFTHGRTGHTLLVNFCNRNDPRPQPLKRPDPARCVAGVTPPHCAA